MTGVFKKLIVACAILVFVLQIASCGKQSTGGNNKEKRIPIRVAFWGAPEEIEIITTTINNWQKSHPDIQVKLEHIPFNGYTSKILTEVAGRSAPDIVAAEVNMFIAFASKEVFLDLKPFIDKDVAFNLNEFFPEVVDRYTINGKIYAIPRDTAPVACVYYNKKLFDEAGVPYPTDDWDWNDLLEKAEKLTKTDKDGRIIQYGYFGDFWTWSNFVYSNGGRMVDNVKKPTKCLLDEPEAIEGLQFFIDLGLKHKVSPTPSALRNYGLSAVQLFMMQRTAMYHSGIWETPIITKTKEFDWDVAMLPKGPKGIRAFTTGGTGYGILKTTQYPDEAWEVLKALSGDEGQIMLAESGLAQPANRRIAEGEHWAKNGKKPLNKKMLNDAVKYVIYEPFHPNWRKACDIYVNPELDLAFNGLKSVKAAVKIIVEEVNKLFNEE